MGAGRRAPHIVACVMCALCSKPSAVESNLDHRHGGLLTCNAAVLAVRHILNSSTSLMLAACIVDSLADAY